MASAWDQAWAEAWASAWGATVGTCAWGGNWGSSWGNSWCGQEVEPEPTLILAGGGDDPHRKRKRKKTQHDLFRELEETIHELLHPETAVEEPEEKPVPVGVVSDETSKALNELLALAQRQHEFLQQTAALRAELEAARQRILDQDEEDALLWMF